eukprot:TRINITY_DN966_c0_g2_i1.p1 TRINITY_DN966_c0_g2~~TRINITY_DN966_c0_g2_i1.p1  ORF type:complete len:182 (+),score=12.90 TRINITY_DN966_c0_g2_i1:170-715(+)
MNTISFLAAASLTQSTNSLVALPLQPRVETPNRHSGRQFRIAASASPDALPVQENPASEVSVSAVPPRITIEFSSPSPDGEPKSTIEIGSGEKNLRRAMVDSKTGLYDAWGTFMNCGGGGTCGTCTVDVLEGEELLSERTEAEGRWLTQKPASWRLACQTIVGNKTNGGTLRIQRLPQKKK